MASAGTPKSGSSRVWGDRGFHLPAAEESGATCKVCGKKLTYRGSKHGTSHLLRHMNSPSCRRRAEAQHHQQEVVAPPVVVGEPFEQLERSGQQVHFSTTTTFTDVVDAAELHPHLLLLPQAAVAGEPFQPSGQQVHYSTTTTVTDVVDAAELHPHLLLLPQQAAPAAAAGFFQAGGQVCAAAAAALADPLQLHGHGGGVAEGFGAYAPYSSISNVHQAAVATPDDDFAYLEDAAELHPYLLPLPQAAPTAAAAAGFFQSDGQVCDAAATAFADPLQLHGHGGGVAESFGVYAPPYSSISNVQAAVAAPDDDFAYQEDTMIDPHLWDFYYY